MAKMAKVLVRKNGSTFLARCGIMETMQERGVGLLNRTSLDADEGLWFPHGTNAHTFFMRFPIDLAFLNSKGKVIALYPSLRPWRMSWWHLFALGGGMLETSAGAFARAGIQVGEELQICPNS